MTTRSFGGRAGTWLRKKRRLATEETGTTVSAAPPESISKASSAVPSVEEDRRLGSDSSHSHNGGFLQSSVPKIIGWDDARGRPIYQRNENSDSSSLPTQNDDDYDIPSPVRRLPYKENTQNYESRPVRSYSRGRNRRASTTDLIDELEASISPEEPSQVVTATTCSSSSSSSDEANSTASSPSFAETESRRLSNIHGHSNNSTASNSDSSVFSFRDSSSFEQQQQDTNASSTKHAQKANTNAITNNNSITTPKSRITVVSSTTSLSAARYFFRKLDRDHTLSFMKEEAETPKRHQEEVPHGRSLRAMSPSNYLQLVQEYEQYTQACRASSVSPLAKAEYINNRAAYFRSKELYDGFLDE